MRRHCAARRLAVRKAAQTVLIAAVLSGRPGSLLAGVRLAYPEARRAEVVEPYHGTSVPDPYRWLEDLDSDETRRWIEAENAVTFDWLQGIPARESIRRLLEARWDYPRVGVPERCGDRLFFTRNEGLQNQSVHYVQEGGSAPRAFLDPNALSEDGTVAVASLWPSRDGALAAYAVSDAGSDWQSVRVRDVTGGGDLSDLLRWIKFSEVAWTHDGRGFFYSRYDEPAPGVALVQVNKNQKLHYHRLGDPQSADVLVYARPDVPEMGFDPEITEDGRYLVLNVWKGSGRRNGLYVLEPPAPDRVIRLFDDFDAWYSFVGNDGDEFYILTDRDAPNRRLVAVNLHDAAPERWRTIIPEGRDVLKAVAPVGGRFVATTLVDVASRVTIHRLDGTLEGEVELPVLGSVSTVEGRPGDGEMFYAFSSFNYPSTVYRYDFARARSEPFHAPEVDFDPAAFEVEQVFYPSRDGTRVPMFLMHRKGIARDGSNPVYLTAYGGFSISSTPSFSASALVWVELGGIYALANIRGGGEYGETWHRAGMLEHKQNVFDDFICAAEYLVRDGWTSPLRLAIGGGSNGGLLTAACLLQRPDMFGAVYVGNGVLDMLRYHKSTIGWAWIAEYGSADDPAQFPFLYAYSPVHNVKPGVSYPPTLIATADHDDRVVPSHSFKFAAALQRAQAGPSPVLLRVDTRAGHGAGKPTHKALDEVADRWAFLAEALGMNLEP